MWLRACTIVFCVFGVEAAAAAHPFLDRYCTACHNQKLRTAGLAFEDLALPGSDEAGDVWERILRKVRSNAMPPPGVPRPPEEVRQDFVRNVEDTLDRQAESHPDPGRTIVHRLNRAEYGNAVRDLLGLHPDTEALLPPDDAGYGFDNIGELLSISPALLERYLAAARQISELALKGPESRRHWMLCQPSRKAEERRCARAILRALARRAYRRPVANSDLKPLLGFFDQGGRKGGFENGIKAAFEALLVSPEFLLRAEHDPAGSPSGSVHRVSGLELASRLSFFLWSSIPDDELLDAAERGALSEPAALDHQVRRMLADSRSDALVANFAGQWLSLRNLPRVERNPRRFPGFDQLLREDFERETELFVADILREDRSVLDLLAANFTFLNERLARHYGIAGVQGDEFRRVELADPRRGGLLGQASILTVTSYPTRTSVVVRGKWILENLLGEPPPPPPPDVPSLPRPEKDQKPVSLRRQMEQHRAQPACAACHAAMDPLGFALENYDPVGKWRDEEAGAPLDTAARLPDGTQFSGPAGLKRVLLDRRDQFIATFTAKLMIYALGRGLDWHDQPLVRAIDREAAEDGFRFSSIVLGIVKSAPFQMRRTP